MINMYLFRPCANYFCIPFQSFFVDRLVNININAHIDINIHFNTDVHTHARNHTGSIVKIIRRYICACACSYAAVIMFLCSRSIINFR